MFTIWAKKEMNSPVVKTECDCILTARIIWDALESKDYYMQSMRP